MKLRKSTTPAMIFAALLVLGAMSASTASAEVETEANTKATLAGVQQTTQVLKTTAGSAECKVANFTATTTSPASTVTVTPTYSSCLCIGIACTVTMNGCTYLLHGGATTTGTADLVCPEGKEVTVENERCIIHIPAQTGLGTNTYSNVGSGTTREVSTAVNISGIKYQHTTVSAGIGTCTTGTGTTGTLTGAVLTTGTVDGGSTHIGIFVS